MQGARYSLTSDDDGELWGYAQDATGLFTPLEKNRREVGLIGFEPLGALRKAFDHIGGKRALAGNAHLALGYTLATEHQGHGYATEALQAMLRHLFTDKGLHRQEGHRKEHTWIKGEWTDDLLFGLLAKDFTEWRSATA